MKREDAPWVLTAILAVALGVITYLMSRSHDDYAATMEAQNASLLHERDSLATLAHEHLQVANSALDSARHYQSLYDSLVAHEPSAQVVYLNAQKKWQLADCTLVYGYLLHRPLELWK